MSYIPNTPEDQEAMLTTLGLPSLEALLSPVPENVRLRRPLDLPPALSEPDLKRVLASMAAKNKNLDTTIAFLGAGTYDHAIPSVVPHLQRRSERRHAVRVTDDHVEKDLSRDAGIFDVHRALCDQFIKEARGRGNGLQPAFLSAKFGNVGKVDGL